MSSMPVREALRQLSTEGVVQHIPYRGARVTQFSPEDVDDLYANRSYLESLAVKTATKNITPEELAEVRALHTQMRDELASIRLSECARLNRRFHRVIYTASRRDYLVRALNSELGVIEQALHEGNDRRQAYQAYLRPPPAEGG